MMNINPLGDGVFEVYGPWNGKPHEYADFDDLLERARQLGVVIRVCRDLDAERNPRPVKFLLSIDPALILGLPRDSADGPPGKSE